MCFYFALRSVYLGIVEVGTSSVVGTIIQGWELFHLSVQFIDIFTFEINGSTIFLVIFFLVLQWAYLLILRGILYLIVSFTYIWIMEIIVGVFVVYFLCHFIRLYAVKWVVYPIGFVLLLPILLPIVCINGIRQKQNAWIYYVLLGCYFFICLLFLVAYLWDADSFVHQMTPCLHCIFIWWIWFDNHLIRK